MKSTMEQLGFVLLFIIGGVLASIGILLMLIAWSEIYKK